MKDNQLTQDQINTYCKRIEESKINTEYPDLDWKTEPNFNDTGYNSTTNNTLQKAVCAMANTNGGKIFIGFDQSQGRIVGFDKPDFDIYCTQKLNSKLSKKDFVIIEPYEYSGTKFWILFVLPSKEPVQCDNGVYYYRESSQSIPMSHKMISKKFKRFFEDEKWLWIIKRTWSILMISLI